MSHVAKTLDAAIVPSIAAIGFLEEDSRFWRVVVKATQDWE